MTDRARVEFDHNRLLKKVANEIFTPLGLVQRGSSRTWFDDHGWWVVMVTFDPSGFGKGSYLKVASTPLWEPGAHGGFGYEYRDAWDHPHSNFGTRFINARRPDWWDRDVRILGAGAIDHVQGIRAAPHDVRTFLDLELERGPGPVHGYANAGIPAGLLGMEVLARDGLADLERLLRPTDDLPRPAREHLIEPHRRIVDLQRAMGDRDAFVRLIADNVARLRAGQKLPPIHIDAIVRDLDAASRPGPQGFRQRWAALRRPSR